MSDPTEPTPEAFEHAIRGMLCPLGHTTAGPFPPGHGACDLIFDAGGDSEPVYCASRVRAAIATHAATIETLRGELDEHAGEVKMWRRLAQTTEAEVTRLRGALEPLYLAAKDETTYLYVHGRGAALANALGPARAALAPPAPPESTGTVRLASLYPLHPYVREPPPGEPPKACETCPVCDGSGHDEVENHDCGGCAGTGRTGGASL